MSECESIRARIDFYLDDELRGAELAHLEAHLQRCHSCRTFVEAERRLLGEVREAKPLYQSPEHLRARVSEILEHAPSYTSPPELLKRVKAALERAAVATFGSNRPKTAILVGSSGLLLVLILGTIYVTRSTRAPIRPPSDFALMAVDNHIRHQRGQLPFEITSDSPELISRWFAGKVPFSLELPNYQESSGQDRLYRLEGARLVGLDNDYAAYIGYRMATRPISLVVTSDSVARPNGGEEIVSKGLTFHYDSFNGLKVITWSDRGLTYALVSDLAERGQQSCVVCHEGTRDRDFIEGLKPRQ